MRIALAANPNLTPKECHRLAQDSNAFVRATLAGNPSLHTPLQFILSADPSASVRIALAARKSLDSDIAVQLSRDTDCAVQAAILHCWSQDPELLHLWAESDQPRIQQLLLQRKSKLEPALVETLSLAPDDATREAAFSQIELDGPRWLMLAESEDTRDRLYLAEQTDLPSSIQRILAHDSSTKVRRRLASNSCIHASIALHIAASDDLSSCRALAKNPAIQDECIALLCTHPDDSIALLIAYREDLNDSHRDLLLNHRSSTTVAEHMAYRGTGYKCLQSETAEALAQAESPTIRAYAAQSSRLEAGTLNCLSRDMATAVRQCTAENLCTPRTSLQALQADPCREVVFAADDTLARQLRTQQADTEPHHEEADEAPEQPRPFLHKIAQFFTE